MLLKSLAAVFENLLTAQKSYRKRKKGYYPLEFVFFKMYNINIAFDDSINFYSDSLKSQFISCGIK